MSKTIHMDDHRRWGDNIQLVTPFAPRRKGLFKAKELRARMIGWMPKTKRPVAGDTILMPVLDGSTAVLLVEKIERVYAVDDMFYAEVKFMWFLDE